MTKIPQKQVTLSDRLAAIDGLTGPGLLQLPAGAGAAPVVAPESAVGATLRTAADAAAVRGAAGLGTLAIQNASSASFSDKVDFGGAILKNSYLAPDFFADANNAVGVFTDRLLGVGAKATVTSNMVDVGNIFDGGYETFGYVTGQTVGVIEIVWPYQVTYQSGQVIVSCFDFAPGSYLTPASVNVELRDASGTWNALFTATDLSEGNAVRTYNTQTGKPWLPFITGIRFTFTPRPGNGTMGITSLQWFATRPNSGDTPQYLFRASPAPQEVFCPSVSVRNAAGSQRTTIGPGSLSINNAPAITYHNSAVVTANGTVQDFALTGLALNDFCQCSTGRDARAVDVGGGVIRLRTDTTGFSGSVKIFALRTA